MRCALSDAAFLFVRENFPVALCECLHVSTCPTITPSMLLWFDQNPLRYWWFVTLVAALGLFIMIRPFLRPDWQDEKKTDWRWSLFIISLLVAGRWPTWFLTEQLNPDESLLITGAQTLRQNPVFWRAVDTGTAGPLDVYAIQPIGWIVGQDGYFSARVTACLLIAFALIFVHQTLALVFGRQVARITTFSAVCVEALTLHDDFLHYSSELVPIALIAAAFHLFARRFATGASWRLNCIAGLLLGSVPFAKLQAVPPAFLLGVVWIAGEFWQRERNGADWRKGLAALLTTAIAPTILCAGFLTVFGLWNYVITSYFQNNVAYANEKLLGFDRLTYEFLGSAFFGSSLLPYWFGGSLLWLFISIPLTRSTAQPGQFITYAAIFLGLVSLLSVLLPGRPYLHYCQLLVVPWTLTLGAITGLVLESLERHSALKRSAILGAALLCSSGGILYARSGLPVPMQGQLVSSQAAPQGAVARALIKYARPGEALGIWGWMPQFYVETGMWQAARRADSSPEIVSATTPDAFRRHYLADLQRSTPPVFVDATGPGNYRFTDRKQSFEYTFPALSDYIHSHYILAHEVEGSRIYVRRDRYLTVIKQP